MSRSIFLHTVPKFWLDYWLHYSENFHWAFGLSQMRRKIIPSGWSCLEKKTRVLNDFVDTLGIIGRRNYNYNIASNRLPWFHRIFPNPSWLASERISGQAPTIKCMYMLSISISQCKSHIHQNLIKNFIIYANVQPIPESNLLNCTVLYAAAELDAT